LLLEIQPYVQGEYLYIPAQQTPYKNWGEKSGIRESLIKKTHEIKSKYRQGFKIPVLADEYCLSVHSIKQIIYKK
jgi:hypothetical protein